MRFVSGVTVRGHSRLLPVTGTDAWLEAGGWSPWGCCFTIVRCHARLLASRTSGCVASQCALPCPAGGLLSVAMVRHLDAWFEFVAEGRVSSVLIMATGCQTAVDPEACFS